MKTNRRSFITSRRKIRFQPVSELLEERRVLSTFLVTTSLDSVAATKNTTTGIDQTNHVSLRSAIEAVNNDQAANQPGPFTIIFPAGMYTLTIPGANEDADLSGDLDINASVTLQGAGAGATTINANNLDRALEVLGGNVTVSGVTITGGLATMGAGILNNGGNLTLLNDTINGNHAIGLTGANGAAGSNASMSGSPGAPGGAAYGGGIDNAAGILAIVNSTISSNSATGGAGGIGGQGLGFTGATGVENVSTNGGPGGNGAGNAGNAGGPGSVGLGGGLYNAAGAQLTVSNTTFSANSAIGGAGGAGGTGGTGTGGRGGESEELNGGPGGTGMGGVGGVGGAGGVAKGGGLYNAGEAKFSDAISVLKNNTATGGAGGQGGHGGLGQGGLGGFVPLDEHNGGAGGNGTGGAGGAGGTGGQAEGGGVYNATGVTPIATMVAKVSPIGGGSPPVLTATQLTAPSLTFIGNIAQGGTGGASGVGGEGAGGAGDSPMAPEPGSAAGQGYYAIAGGGGIGDGGAGGIAGTGGAGLGGGLFNDQGGIVSITGLSGGNTPVNTDFEQNNALGGAGGAGSVGGTGIGGNAGQSEVANAAGDARGGTGGTGGQGGISAGGALMNLGSASLTGVTASLTVNLAQAGNGGKGGAGGAATGGNSTPLIGYGFTNQEGPAGNAVAGSGGNGGNGGSAHGGAIDNGADGTLTVALVKSTSAGSALTDDTDSIQKNQAIAGTAGAGGATGKATPGEAYAGYPATPIASGHATPGSSGAAGVGGTGSGGGATFDPAGTASLSNITITSNTASTSHNDVEGTYTVPGTPPSSPIHV